MRRPDVERAVASIVEARMSFGGSSQYAPNLVLVHRKIMNEFNQACAMRTSLEYVSSCQIYKREDSEWVWKNKPQHNSLGKEICGLNLTLFDDVDDAVRSPYIDHSTHGDSPLAAFIFADGKNESLIASKLPFHRLVMFGLIPTWQLLERHVWASDWHPNGA
ncbi:hypothetical protein QBC38DRAFT_486500 [Podospora fimiseda]|uniref:Uncharacterized protein n=1 Tax=Podospora fimiseda TaxID=252190 RepID=A0AAN7BIC1_9PEZI|nr:hypothetical protein QBC38DRAFT_486500 [Podospora fimiseda]